MAIVRTPSRRFPVRNDLDDFNALANRLFGSIGSTTNNVGDWLPSVNVRETAEGLLLTAELPGMTPEDVNVEFENNVLTIRGEKHEASESEEDQFHIAERRFGSFRRSFTLPRTVDSSKIDASFDNGVLSVVLPKAAEAMSRKIEVSGPSA